MTTQTIEAADSVQVPSGTRFYGLDVVAESWEEWDRFLTWPEFTLREWWCDDGGACAEDAPDARLHRHLERQHGTGRIVIYPPPFDREASA